MLKSLLSIVITTAAIGVAPVLAQAPAPAPAALYPSKPIKMIVPFTPGTGIDNIARVVGQKMAERLGEPVVIENRTGVAGNLGARLVGLAPADGYTLLVTSNNLTINANLYPTKDFNAMNDLAPLSIGAWGNSTLVSNPKFPFSTLAEVINYAKANPDKLSFASAGVGSPMHIQLEQFQAATGTRFRHIPYKGTAPAVADLMGGHVDLGFIATHTVAANVKGGQLKAIAVGSQSRHRVLPEVPSFGELGLTKLSTDMWYGFLAPRATPPNIIAKLEREIAAILALPDVKAGLEKTGLDVRATTAAEMDAVMKREYADFGAIIQRNNIKPE